MAGGGGGVWEGGGGPGSGVGPAVARVVARRSSVLLSPTPTLGVQSVLSVHVEHISSSHHRPETTEITACVITDTGESKA